MRKKTERQDIVEEKMDNIADLEDVVTNLPQKDLFRIDEVAKYFDVHENTIRLWISHGHLENIEKHGGLIRVPRLSILRCRFRSRIIRI